MADRIPSSRDDLTADVAELVHAIGHRVRAELRRDLAGSGVTWAQLRALRVASNADPSITMSGLADALRIVRRSATSLVDELEARGLVRRVGVECDRRATAVEVTDAGLSVLRTLDEHRRAAAAAVLAPLSASDLAAVREALAKAVR